MSYVRGAVVVQRPDLAQALDKISPAPDVDFVRTLQSYFSLSESSLLRCATREVSSFTKCVHVIIAVACMEVFVCALGHNAER